MRPRDTSEEAHRIQLEVWRRKSGSERLKAIFEMSEFVRECAKSRIRKQHPDLTEQEVTNQLIFELYGVRVPRRAQLGLG